MAEVDKVKQLVLQQGALDEIHQIILTMQSIETQLHQLVTVDLARLDTQFSHLKQLAKEIGQKSFPKELHHFSRKRAESWEIQFSDLIVLSQDDAVRGTKLLRTLAEKKKKLESELGYE